MAQTRYAKFEDGEVKVYTAQVDGSVLLPPRDADKEQIIDTLKSKVFKGAMDRRGLHRMERAALVAKLQANGLNLFE